jgi:hypothetical protein
MPASIDLPTPENSEEGSYVAVAAVSELLKLLVDKRVIDRSDVGDLLRSIVGRLKKENNFGSERASRFLAQWMDRKE